MEKIVIPISLLERFQNVRRTTELLCEPLTVEDCMLSVTADTSPPKWHLAHTNWFLEKFVLRECFSHYEPYNQHFDFIFNSYYKKLGGFLPKSERQNLSRPSLEEVLIYRYHVTNKVEELIQHSPSRKFFAQLELAINHEEQHQELLLMDIKMNFFKSSLRPIYQGGFEPVAAGEPKSEWRHLPAGMTTIGHSKKNSVFAYDNEKDAHQVWRDSSLLASHLVTNDEFLEFIESGGYEDPLLWLADGWDFKEKENWTCPLYWEKIGDEWWTFSHRGMIPLELNAPVVHVSYYEADAFARYKGARLPTEVEWEAAAHVENNQGHFLEEADYLPQISEEDFYQFSQIHGSVWEWTQSAYLPYPRFEPMENTSEYNGKFMSGQYVLRGGSCATPKEHYRMSYRNFYYPHMRWQYAGIRLAKDLL